MLNDSRITLERIHEIAIQHQSFGQGFLCLCTSTTVVKLAQDHEVEVGMETLTPSEAKPDSASKN